METSRDSIDMAEEENLPKAPRKRKTPSIGSSGSQSNESKNRKAKSDEPKKAKEQQDTDSSDCVTDSDDEYYTVEKIKHFLQKTKHCKMVEVGEHFSDPVLFAIYAKEHIRRGRFANPEITRLKEFFQKIRLELASDGSEST